MIEGIDVSYYQGDIFWPKVAKAKKFAIIRSGDGTFLDPKFEPYIKGALENGVAVPGVYHYLEFALDPESHADICARRLEQAKGWGAKDFLWLDWEETSAHCKGMTVLQRQQWASEFLDSLENNCGCREYGHYTGSWWFGPYLGKPTAGHFFDHPLWIGQYPYGCLSDPTVAGLKPSLPAGWADWQVWQYTSSGRVEGIGGSVDLNIAKDGFLGQEDDMSFDDTDRNRLRAVENLANRIYDQGRDNLVQPEGRGEIYIATVDELIHVTNPAVQLGNRFDPADVQVLPATNKIFRLPTTFPGGVPDLK